MLFLSIKPEEKPKEKVIPCKTKNRWILPEDAKFVDSLDRQAAEELLKGETNGVELQGYFPPSEAEKIDFSFI